MKIHGACQCGHCETVAEGPVELAELAPRVCDCDYCQQHPSAVISDPRMVIAVTSKSSIDTDFNGSGQATFYYCPGCKQLVAVGATFDGRALGAVNAYLFGDLSQFGAPVSVQPWRLTPAEKAARWSTVWGRLTISCA